LSRFGNRGRKALSYVAVPSEALCAAFHLPLPELSARFPSRTQDQAHSRMSRLLPGAQRRRVRPAVSSEAGSFVAAFDSLAPALSPGGLPVHVARVPAAPLCQTPGARLGECPVKDRRYSSSGLVFSAFSPRNFAWINMSISPSITACTLLVSAPVRWSLTI
jgi:hypothetical protein